MASDAGLRFSRPIPSILRIFLDTSLPFPLSLRRPFVLADVPIGNIAFQSLSVNLQDSRDKRRFSTIKDRGKYATTTRVYTRLRVYQLLPITTYGTLSY